MYYDRYSQLKRNNIFSMLPFIKLDVKNTDKYEKYILNKTRLDNLSYKYYKSPYYGWLILLANPEYLGLEFYIPDNAIIRIPYPLELTLNEYNEKLNNYIKLYKK